MTVPGPANEQQPDGMSHGGGISGACPGGRRVGKRCWHKKSEASWGGGGGAAVELGVAPGGPSVGSTGRGGGIRANYWAPLTRKRHTMPHPAQPQHTDHWAPRTKRHQREPRP